VLQAAEGAGAGPAEGQAATRRAARPGAGGCGGAGAADGQAQLQGRRRRLGE